MVVALSTPLPVPALALGAWVDAARVIERPLHGLPEPTLLGVALAPPAVVPPPALWAPPVVVTPPRVGTVPITPAAVLPLLPALTRLGSPVSFRQGCMNHPG